MTALVRLEHVTKTYPAVNSAHAPVTAVDDVSLEIERGDIFGIIGYSGAGKSTLVRLMNALEQPTSGKVFVADRELTTLPEREIRRERRTIGMIFQQFNLFHSRTVAGNVAYPLTVAGMRQPERDRRVAELLDFVGLLPRAHSYPEQLSGGQKQRVGIARALATRPQLLLADEATSALDPDTTADVLELLRRVNRDLGVTIVVITHEMEAIRSIANRVAVMDSGRIVERGEVYDVFSRPSSDITARFVRSVLRNRPSGRTLARLRQQHPGTIVTVELQESPGFQYTLRSVFADHRVGAEIVFGGISELQDRSVGSLTYELTGEYRAITAALEQLRMRGVTVVEED
ncbi:methionine ABC transporter ATP-binding protein [Parafrigoribacterium mesophilum]|uniref:methionine ABC transporter ATP-binding protein n=1 Tax=Parafrigoribacterium mesophilum TaxID=433646 RepID=UPI0031FD8F85